MAGFGAAAVLTACGGSDGSDGGGGDGTSADDFAAQPGKEIVAAARAAMADLESLKLAGSITADGQEIDLDIQTNADGDCAGSIGIAGGTAELLGVGGDIWFKPDTAFWEASAGAQADQIISLVGDKWVVVGEDDGFSEFCDVDELLEELISDEDDKDTTFTKGDVTDVDGGDAIPVESTEAEDGASTAYVLVDAPNYLVKIEKTEGEDTGSVTFSEFDETFEVEAPAEDDTIDPSALNGG